MDAYFEFNLNDIIEYDTFNRFIIHCKQVYTHTILYFCFVFLFLLIQKKTFFCFEVANLRKE